ncbi:MAG: tRNA 5-methylaminomethyl-2-thiouridine biosynthesis bifunctional protein [Pseudohongiellaceae bacterium]|jgi:tRNA 5-methylaminomethyl-2-thiouridine biosynthesis bifunctional protein
MPLDNSKTLLPADDSTFQIENAVLDWADEANPRSIKFDDIYYSTAGAAAESAHVFLNGTALTARWQNCKEKSPVYSIAEIGFGSGLNFLNTWQLWQQSTQKPNRLHYIAFEKYPLKKTDLERLLSNWPSLSSQVTELLKHYPEHGCISHRLPIAADITLDLHFGDALRRLKTIDKTLGSGIDSWFLDGFSPRLNPDLWQAPLIKEMARLSLPGATVASYSAAGFIRRQLRDAGFKVERQPGYGKKRHMTAAIFSDQSVAQQTIPTHTTQPWFVLPAITAPPKTATVIGAGLAGCSTAYALAQRGIEVTVVDSGKAAAAGASGIRQLALRPRLFKTGSALAEFYLQSFLFAAAQFKNLSPDDSNDQFWFPSGVIQLLTALNKRSELSNAALEILYGSEIVKHLNKTQAAEIAGTLCAEDVLHFKLGGWVDAPLLCKRYLESDLIRFVGNCTIKHIERPVSASQWQAHPQQSDLDILQSDIIVLANSYSASLFPIAESLPLQTVRGQASYVDGTEASHQLRTVLSGQRSLFPTLNSKQTVAASYRRDVDLIRNEEDDQENLTSLASDFPQFSTLKAGDYGIGVRCNTPDFKPIVGMAPNIQKMAIEYADLRRDAHKEFTNPGHYHDGLYLSLAHGSNGLATAPLAGETLASLICGELSPLSTQALANLSGARFVIRDLKRQKP